MFSSIGIDETAGKRQEASSEIEKQLARSTEEIMESQLSDPADRSVQNLAESLRESIRTRTNGSIRGLEVTVNGGAVVVSGRTSRYYYKQLATSAVLAASTQHDLTNSIEVERATPRP